MAAVPNGLCDMQFPTARCVSLYNYSVGVVCDRKRKFKNCAVLC